MSKDSKRLKKLHKGLSDALCLIEERVSSLQDVTSLSKYSIDDSESFLEKCKAVVESKQKTKPIMRIVHHLACSGGTLISKCISGLPNTYLLSELHPTTKLHIGDGKPKFSPSDVITLCRYANIPDVDKIALDTIKYDIGIVSKHMERLGGYLVLREHTHSDFCVGSNAASGSKLLEVLKGQYKINNIATVRHPVDCYISLSRSGWLHFEPSTFDEYCLRYLSFIEQFKPQQIVKYEDFIKDSDKVMKEIAEKLELPYSSSCLDTFSCFRVTGDSGRGGDKIERRERRPISDKLAADIECSQNYKNLVEKLDYDASVN